ncbi:hypothetical protein ACRRTK_013731 [Alexandromys fortis]
MSTPVTSDTAPRFQKPMNYQKRKRLGKVKTAMSDRRSERSAVSPKAPCNQNDSRKEVSENRVCLAEKALQAKSIPVSRGASAKDVREQRSKRKRGHRKRKLENVMAALQASSMRTSMDGSAGDAPDQNFKKNNGQRKRKLETVMTTTQESRLQASRISTSEATPRAASELKFTRRKKKRSIWTVDHIEGTKLTVKKKRRPSYRPEDLEAFYRILQDPVVQNFLAADIFFRMTDKYLLSMVVEYFGRLGLPGHLYNRIHFFLALYIACDMEEDDPISKRSIFQFLLGTDTWQDLYKDFQRLQGEFLQVIDYRAWVTRQECEEIQNQNPHHWVWSRVRQSAP